MRVHTSELKINSLLVMPPDAWCCGVKARTGWHCVSVSSIKDSKLDLQLLSHCGST